MSCNTKLAISILLRLLLAKWVFLYFYDFLHFHRVFTFFHIYSVFSTSFPSLPHFPQFPQYHQFFYDCYGMGRGPSLGSISLFICFSVVLNLTYLMLWYLFVLSDYSLVTLGAFFVASFMCETVKNYEFSGIFLDSVQFEV